MALSRFRLDGKVAFVLGAGRGIGAASALALAEAGASVVLAARSVDQLDETAEAVRGLGRQALVVPTDASDADSTAAAIEAAVAEFGRLDILINVVGGAMPAPFLSSRDKDFTRAFELNVVTHMRAARLAAPLASKCGAGSIVNVSTAMAHMVGRGYAVYGSVKAGLDHATRLLAADLAPKVRVNGVAPGAIATEALNFVMQDEKIRTAIIKGTPMRRLGEPDDIAAAVLYLASPASSYVTGKIIEVDGGIVVPNFDLGLPDL
jgi:7-alpha-hydroxysteroid dehydrogenase